VAELHDLFLKNDAIMDDQSICNEVVIFLDLDVIDGRGLASLDGLDFEWRNQSFSISKFLDSDSQTLLIPYPPKTAFSSQARSSRYCIFILGVSA